MSWWSEPLLPEYNPYSSKQIRFVLLTVLAVGGVFVISAFRFSATLSPEEKAVLNEEAEYLKFNKRSSLENLKPYNGHDATMIAKRRIVDFMRVSKERVKHPDENLLALSTTSVYWVPENYKDFAVKEMDDLREQHNLQNWIPGRPELAGYNFNGDKTKYWKDPIQRREYRKQIEAQRIEDWKNPAKYMAELVAKAKADKEKSNGR